MDGALPARFAAVLLVLLLPVLATANPTEKDVSRAARAAGLGYAAFGLPVASTPDSLLPPGRSEMPMDDARPLVILPGTWLAAEADEDSAQMGVPGPAAEGDPVFGMEFFTAGDEHLRGPAFGPVPSGYILGPGDQVLLDVWGEVEFRQERVVERDGSIMLRGSGKIHCAGLTLAEAESRVRRSLSDSYSGIGDEPGEGDTFVGLSLGQLRAIRVFVVGEAAHPGAYDVSSVSTIFAALYAAGGPSSAGSLRDVRLLRDGELMGSLDLYRYLLEGRRDGDLSLREGDTVFLPARGGAVELLGAVRRARVFEIRDGETLGDLLAFGGGLLAEASTEALALERILPPDQRSAGQADRVHLDMDSSNTGFPLEDGDRITVRRIENRVDNWVEVQGNLKLPGRYQFRPGMSVADLVARAGGPWPDTLLERALLDRENADLGRSTVDFHLGDQLRGKGAPILLRSRDRLTTFSKWDLEDRASVEISGQVRNPGRYEFRDLSSLRDLILKAGGPLEPADLSRVQVFRLREDAMESPEASPVPEQFVDLIEVSLGDNWLSESENFLLQAHDHVALRRLPWWGDQRRVELRGEFLFPGSYSLEKPAARLSDVVERAGGLRPTADPLGARINRAQDDVGIVALDLQKALNSPGSAHDPILAPGDVVTVPSQSHTVKVVGAVGFSTSVIYVKGRSLKNYVEMAGGFASSADKRGSYVVYPNGVSRSLRWFGFNQPDILPGSTIVVPFEVPKEGDSKLQTLREIAAIIASVATVWLVIDRTQ
ncbi:SLBB domain-containing protein [bacterium]|nr:SLBB domain-containing protein [bacterium]